MDSLLHRRRESIFLVEEEMSEKQFINYYRCPDDGREWADVWSCCCNDMCPKCGMKDIEPYKSEAVVHTRERKHVHQKPIKERSPQGLKPSL